MDPWTLAILIVCGVALALLAWGAAEELWQRRAPKPQPEPTAPALPAHEQCGINDCPRAWQTERHGWRLCHTHYRQLVHKDGAA